MKLLSVVFSFRNEEGNLQELVSRVHKCIDKISNWNYEAIFVNDDSTDNSENILLELQKKYDVPFIFCGKFAREVCSSIFKRFMEQQKKYEDRK